MIHLSIVIPAYNEADRLPETLVLVKDYVEQEKYECEVVVVDDGSTDGTAAVVREWQKRFPQLRLLANKQNKGKGAVVAQGMLEAKGAYRLFMDADHSTPITELPKLLAYVADFPVVVGSRYLEKDSIKVRQPLKRRIISRTSNFFIQKMVLPGIVDTQCGFKLFTAEAAEAIFPKVTMDGWSFDIEVLAVAKAQGFAVKEVPVDWFDAKLSKLRATRGAARFVKELVTISVKARKHGYR